MNRPRLVPAGDPRRIPRRGEAARGDSAVTGENRRGLLVTAGIASRWDETAPLLAGLHAEAAKPSRALLADCGGFFGRGRYYEYSGGRLESDVLAHYYDVLAPDAIGLRHYLEDERLSAKTVCANIVDLDGRPVFAAFHALKIGRTFTLVTSVMSRRDFQAIPPSERQGMRWTDPANTLTALGARRPPHGMLQRALVVLSYDTVDAAIRLARQCPAITAIFTRHDPGYAPSSMREGNTHILIPRKQAASYAMLRAQDADWIGKAALFPEPIAAPDRHLAEVNTRIAKMSAQLLMPLGRTRSQWRTAVPDRRELLTRVAQHVLGHLDEIDSVVLNESVIIPRRLDAQVTRGAVLDIAPGDVRLVRVELAPGGVAKLAGRLHAHLGPVLALTRPWSGGGASVRVATSSQIARDILGIPHRDVGRLTDHLVPALTRSGGKIEL